VPESRGLFNPPRVGIPGELGAFKAQIVTGRRTCPGWRAWAERGAPAIAGALARSGDTGSQRSHPV